jgi:type 1 glutamine amidotransferase
MKFAMWTPLLVLAVGHAAEAPKNPRIVFVTGDDEYRSEYSMPAMGRILQARYGFRVSVAYAKPTPQSNKNIEGLEALEDADIAVFYLRWRELPADQMRRILAYLDSGRPLVGLRTSTHAFRYPKGSEFEKWNDGFGREVFGQKWIRHHGHLSSTDVTLVPEQAHHPILRGVERSFHVRSWLYVVNPLEGDCTPLAIGRSVNPQDGKDAGPQPVAWTKTWRGARVFFTTLGHPEDFQVEAFRRLFLNGVLWASGMEVPKGGANAAFVGEYQPPPSGVPPKR